MDYANDNEVHERFNRMFEGIRLCIAHERPFVDIAQIISEGLAPCSPSKEWPDIVLEDILDAEVIGE